MIKFDRREEEILSRLSALYKARGFKRYKPACFEEYSLYQENKDFLIGKNVIAFSDLSGKLMAMRPDVTLSLIRHNDVAEGYTDKFFYNEKVYRQASDRKDFKEISQIGAEVVGAIDGAVGTELTILICETLASVSENYLLDLSEMGFTEGLLSEFPAHSQTVACYLKNKNLHDFYRLAEREKFSEALVNAFKVAVTCGGKPSNALAEAESVCLNGAMKNAVDELKNLTATLNEFGYGEKINVNFSAVSNADYYNGVIFNGYLEGVPHCVLSGGRYDKLLGKFGKKGGAIGFALYLGEIERYLAKDGDGVDYLVIYDGLTESKALSLAQEKIKQGESVRISQVRPVGLNFKNLIDLTEGTK